MTRRRALVACCLGVLLAACGPNGDPTVTPDPDADVEADDTEAGRAAEPDEVEPDDAEAAEPAAPEVPAELAFTLPALDGGEIDGAELAGGDVVLWFWTPW